MARWQRELTIDLAFVIRFLAFGAAMAFANVVPYLRTREAYHTDGMEIAGWPLRCYEMGGFIGLFSFHPWALAGNIMIAVAVSGFAAWIFRDGVLKTLWRIFRKWQTWGTPFAE